MPQMQQIRHMGITDSVMGMATNRMEKSKDEKFSDHAPVTVTYDMNL